MSLLLSTRVLPDLPGFPANPYTGQTAIYSPPGRNVEYSYIGGMWVPKQSFGALDIYIDPVNGVDLSDRGYGAGVNAFKTIQYAWNNLPPVLDQTLHKIHLAAGNYAESPYINGKSPPGLGHANNGILRIEGTLTDVADLVATGGLQGAGANHARIAGAFVAGVYDGLLVEFTSGANNGLFRIVGLTTVGNLYLEGKALNAAPANGDTYKVHDWGSVISGNTDIGPLLALQLLNTKFTAAASGVLPHGNSALSFWGWVSGSFTQCQWETTGAANALLLSQNVSTIHNSIVRVTGAKIGIEIENNGGQAELNGIKIVGNGIAGAVGIRVLTQACLTAIRYGSEISGFPVGIYLAQNSTGQAYTPDITTYIHGCSGIGILAQQSSNFFNTGAAHITYGQRLDGGADLNGANESAEAASFSYID